MWIDGGDGDPLLWKMPGYEPDQPDVALRRNPSESFAQGNVYGCENDLEGGREKGHRILFNVCAGSKEIGLAVKISADGFLVYRRRDNSVDTAGESILAGSIQVGKGSPA